MSTRSPFGLPRGDDNESSGGNEPSDDSKNLDEMTLSTVSYTHLTLPTKA